MPAAAQNHYEFGPFRLEAGERRLWRDGVPIALTEKVFDLLLLLVQNPGRALGKAELMQKLWPDTIVEENNLSVNISVLRKALAEQPAERRYIETLPRRGYRFVAEVRTADARPLPPAGERPLPPAGERSGAAFVGRERELDRLQALWTRAALGQGRVVLVTGEPGMGKSELCEQFAQRLRSSQPGLLAATGHCLQQYGPGEAYLPLLDALRGLLLGPHGERVRQVIRERAPTWCGQFPALFARAEQAEGAPRVSSPARMLRELGDALEALSASLPLLLVLEDMHWADPSSTDLLQLLAQRVSTWRALLLVTLRVADVERERHPLRNVRRELLAHDQCEELALPLLAPQCLSSYLDQRFQPHALPPELASALSARTEGQPLFATRLVQLLVESGDIAQQEGRWVLCRPVSELTLAVPASVRGVIETKLESLADADRRALQYASAIGVEFNSATLAELLPMEELALDERLDLLARVHRLVEPLGQEPLPAGRRTLRHRFAHVLYHTVLYEGLVSKRREQLHARVAARLLADHTGDVSDIAAQLAVHFEAARELEPAITYSRIAGDKAGRWHAQREARQHYVRALSLAQEPQGVQEPQRTAHAVLLHYNLGWCCFNLGEAEASLRHFEAMLEQSRSSELMAATPAAQQALAALFEYFTQPWRDAFGLYAMARMVHQDPSLGANAFQCEAYSALVYVLWYLGRVAEMGVRVQEFSSLAQAAHNEPRRVEALAWMAIYELDRSHFERSRRLLEENLPDCRALGHQRALYLCCYTAGRLYHLLADYYRATALTTETLALTFEAKGRVECLRRLGLAQAHLGRLGVALELLDEAFEVARRSEFEELLLGLTNARGWVYLELGDEARALELFARAAQQALERDSPIARAQSLINLAQVATRRGDLAAARAALQDAEQLLAQGEQLATPTRRDRHQLHLQAAWGGHWLLGGELERAAECGALVLDLAIRQATPKHRAIAHLLLARVALARGAFEAAGRAGSAGLDALANGPIPLLVGRLHAVIGCARREAGDSAGATQAFRQALASLDDIGQHLNAEQRRVWDSSREVQRLRALAP